MKSLGRATLQNISGVDILNLFGTENEMARQHGQLLKEKIRKGTVPFLADKIETDVATDGPLKNHPIFRKIALFYMNFFVFRKLIKNIPPVYRDITINLCEAAGIPPMSGFKAGAMPDAMSILSKLVGKHIFPNIDIQTFGCTSFAMYDQMTPEGEMMVGRNLDFPCSQYWDEAPLIIYHHPAVGQKYCSITTAGINVAGITGFNESGLTVAIHQLFSRKNSADGVPIVLICAEIVRKAKSLDDAVQICKQMKRASDWAIMVTSHKEKRAIVIETSYKNVFVREAEEGLIAQSNYCFNPETKKNEIFFNWTTAEDNFFRKQRLIDRCKELKGKMNEHEGVSLLGDCYDALAKRTKSVGRVVSTIYSVQSAFFRPDLKKFWVSTGKAPANLTEHIELPMDWTLSQNLEDKPIHKIAPNRFSLTDQFKAKRNFAIAFHHFADTKDLKQSLAFIEAAIKFDPTEFAYAMAKGFISLKVDDFDTAKGALESCLKLNITHHERALATLFLGRCHDLLGERDIAKSLYKRYIEDKKIDQKLMAAYKKNWQKAYKRKDIEMSIFQFIFSDFLNY